MTSLCQKGAQPWDDAEDGVLTFVDPLPMLTASALNVHNAVANQQALNTLEQAASTAGVRDLFRLLDEPQ